MAITYRNIKGSALTHTELDTNFSDLVANDDDFETRITAREALAAYGAINVQATDAVTVSAIGVVAKTLPFSNNGYSSALTADASNNRLTITAAGIYVVNFNISMHTLSSGNSGIYEFHLMDDGVRIGVSAVREMSGGNDTGSSSFSFLVNAGAGSHLTIDVLSDNGGNNDTIAINFSNLIAHRID